MRDKLAELKLNTHYMTKLVEHVEDSQYVYLITQWMNRCDLASYMLKH